MTLKKNEAMINSFILYFSLTASDNSSQSSFSTLPMTEGEEAARELSMEIQLIDEEEQKETVEEEEEDQLKEAAAEEEKITNGEAFFFVCEFSSSLSRSDVG